MGNVVRSAVSLFQRQRHAQHNAAVLADMEWRMSLLLDDATGGRLSKPYYSIQDMRAAMAEYHAEMFKDAYDEGFLDATEQYA